MVSLSFLLTGACFAIALLAEGFKLTPIVITTSTLSLMSIGYSVLDRVHGTNLGLLYAGGIAALLAGYYIDKKCVSRSSSNTGAVPYRRTMISTAAIFLLFVVTLVIYHFSVVGIPLLSADVETERFNFAGSGLFGIPGRMLLFGLPFCTFLISNGLERVRRPSQYRWLLLLCWAALVFANVAAGFKGGITNLVIIGLFVASINRVSVSLRAMLLSSRVVIVLAAIGFGMFISYKYTTVAVGSPAQALSYLGLRTTVIAADPGHLALRMFGVSGRWGEYFLADTSYFVHKYFAFAFIQRNDLFTLENIISARLSGVPLSNDSFLVPVTVGAFPELVVNIGCYGGFIVMLIIGVVYSHLYAKAQYCTQPLRTALYTFSLYMLHVYILNGNLAYAMVNLLLMSIALGGLFMFARTSARWLAIKMPMDDTAPKSTVPIFSGSR